MATVVAVSSVAEAALACDSARADLVVANVIVEREDVGSFLPRLLGDGRRVDRVFVMSSNLELVVLKVLESLPIIGAFATFAEDVGAFEAAIAKIADGGGYWSPSIIETLVTDRVDANSVFHRLTATECKVLAVIGTGCSNAEAAKSLPLNERAIQNARRSIYRKLNVNRRVKLMRRAEELGFVIGFGPTRAQPGFTLARMIESARRREIG